MTHSHDTNTTYEGFDSECDDCAADVAVTDGIAVVRKRGEEWMHRALAAEAGLAEAPAKIAELMRKAIAAEYESGNYQGENLSRYDAGIADAELAVSGVRDALIHAAGGALPYGEPDPRYVALVAAGVDTQPPPEPQR